MGPSNGSGVILVVFELFVVTPGVQSNGLYLVDPVASARRLGEEGFGDGRLDCLYGFDAHELSWNFRDCRFFDRKADLF